MSVVEGNVILFVGNKIFFREVNRARLYRKRRKKLRTLGCVSELVPGALSVQV